MSCLPIEYRRCVIMFLIDNVNWFLPRPPLQFTFWTFNFKIPHCISIKYILEEKCSFNLRLTTVSSSWKHCLIGHIFLTMSKYATHMTSMLVNTSWTNELPNHLPDFCKIQEHLTQLTRHKARLDTQAIWIA